MITRLLQWGDAGRDDVGELQGFECTHAARKSAITHWEPEHDCPPALRAERLVHDLRPGKAARKHQRIWVGRDEHGIAAVIAWTWQRPGLAYVDVAALSRRLRQRGTTYTDEMVDTAQAQMGGEALARGVTDVVVVAYIHEENRTANAFALRMGMARFGPAAEDGYVLHRLSVTFELFPQLSIAAPPLEEA